MKDLIVEIREQILIIQIITALKMSEITLIYRNLYSLALSRP